MIDSSYYINSVAYQLDHVSGPAKANKRGMEWGREEEEFKTKFHNLK